MQILADAGSMHEASVSIFPSITPPVTSSIVTGCYPSEHGIEGAAWFQAPSGEIAYYGDDFWVIAREGPAAFARDVLLRLNGEHLKAPTLFELVEADGKRTASRNYLVYRAASAPAARAASLGHVARYAQRGDGIWPSCLHLGSLIADRSPGARRRRPAATCCTASDSMTTARRTPGV
jgi:hypothetical protein